MRKGKLITFSVMILCLLSLLVPLLAMTAISVGAEGERRITLSTDSVIRQGETRYAYVYMDSVESLSALRVEVYFDSTKINVIDSYNSVACELYDSSVKDGCLQYTYIFNGEDGAIGGELFYFAYTVLPDATLGTTYFDIMVTDAYDAALTPVAVGGSRHDLTVTEYTQERTTYAYGTTSLTTAVKQELEISYSLGAYEIASGAFVIQYDPELFAFVEWTPGGLLDRKLVDVNADLAGAIYVSFVGTEYSAYQSDLGKIRFRTLRNTDTVSEIQLSVTELTDLDLNPIACTGYTTHATVQYDPSYTEDAPAMTLLPTYEHKTGQVSATIRLDPDSHLGAGDFTVKFDPSVLTFASATKGFAPSFFHINDKKAADGELKFSVISLSDITAAETVLTLTFDAKPSCTDYTTNFELSGSELSNALTAPIVLNFVDSPVVVTTNGHDITHHPAQAPTCTAVGRNAYETCSRCDYSTYVEIPATGHTEAIDASVAPTCTETGLTQGAHCSVCGEILLAQTVIPAAGHIYTEALTPPTCTEQGYTTYTCHCGDKHMDNYVDATGHTNLPAIEEGRLEATCTENGSYEAVIFCSICQAEISREPHIIPAAGHTAVSDAYVAPTCTATGLTEGKHCSVCREVLVAQTDIPAKGHTPAPVAEENRIEADCIHSGSYDAVIYCSICQAEISRESHTIPATGHTESEWTVILTPDIGKEGKEQLSCTVCGVMLDERTIPALPPETGSETEPDTDTESETDLETETAVITTEETRVESETSAETLVPSATSSEAPGSSTTSDGCSSSLTIGCMALYLLFMSVVVFVMKKDSVSS